MRGTDKKGIAIVGSNGQLGSDLVRVFSRDKSFRVYPLAHKDIEITDEKSIKTALNVLKPDIILSTAAYTKVDEAESNPEKAFLINAIGAKNLSKYCEENGQTFIFISTDYVFGFDTSRNTPYSETDTPGPINTYGISKLAGEQFVRSNLSKYFIIRTTGLFGMAGSSGKGYNFIELMLRLAKEKDTLEVVTDQISTPTYTLGLAHQINRLVKTEHYGLYHITAAGQCSWYEFANEIFRLTKMKIQLKPVTTEQFASAVKRPRYSVMENANLKKLNIYQMRNWKEGLRDYLKEKNII